MNKIRILVVDDHPLMREALCAAISVEPDMEVVGQASNGLEAVAQAQALAPDVIVMDLLMPGQDGLEATVAIRGAQAGVRILALTSSTAEESLWAAIQAGVHGYLCKDAQRDELLRAIRAVSQGEPFLPPSAARALMERVRRQGQPALAPAAEPPMEPLTEREREVLRLIGQGASNRSIAQQLCLSEGTVRVHIHHILGKLGLESRSQAVIYALRTGLAGDASPEG